MAGQGPYAALARIADPHLKAALKLILDQLGALQGQAAGIGGLTQPLTTPLDASGHPLTQVGDPSQPLDAVNLQTLQQYLAGGGDLAKPIARPSPAPIAPGSGPGTPPTIPNAPPPSDPMPSEPIPGPAPLPPPPSEPSAPQTGTGNLRIAGTLFHKPDGSIYRWKSCTDFLLFKRYLDGENIVPILADRTGEGASMVRVLGMCENITAFRPRDYGNYLAQLPSFADLLAANGLDLEFVVFADAQASVTFVATRDQQVWLQAVRDALVGKANVVLELVNEGFQNGVDFRNHTRPSGVLCAADAQAPTDGLPANPPWDYVTFHSGRDAEWPRKSKDAIELSDQFKRPAVDDEPMGADEISIAGSRSNVPDDFFYLAATAMLLGAGATFHSTDGITSTIFRPTTRLCAQSFYAGLNIIPDNVMGGRYTRGPLSDCPLQHDDALALRTFASYTAHNAVCVVVRPQPAWVAIAQAGWTIASSAGPGGCVVFLTK